MPSSRLQELDVNLQRRHLETLEILKRHLASIKLEISKGTPIAPEVLKDLEEKIARMEQNGIS